MDTFTFVSNAANAKLETFSENAKKKLIKVHVSNKFIRIPIEKIVRLQGDCNYTYVYTQSNMYVAARTLKNFEEFLGNEFFIRVHKSHIVNMRFIKNIDIQKSCGEVRCEGGKQIEVSRRKLKTVVERFVYFNSL